MIENYADLTFKAKMSWAWAMTRANWKILSLIMITGWSSIILVTSMVTVVAGGLIGIRYGLITAMLLAHYIFIPYVIGIFKLILSQMEKSYQPDSSLADMRFALISPFHQFGDFFGLINALICFLALTPQMAMAFLGVLPEPLWLPFQVLVCVLCYMFFTFLVCCQAAFETEPAGSFQTLSNTISLIMENAGGWASAAIVMLLLCLPSMCALFNGFQGTNVWSGNYINLALGLLLLMPAAMLIFYLYAITFKQTLANMVPRHDCQ